MDGMGNVTENLPAFLRRGVQVQIDCNVQLAEFEGPLDLLLHLIKSQELDILNLPIAKITGQYLLYLDYMREMNLDLASEYLVMAATLTYLKSQVILPQEQTSEATGPDPRAQLIRRLVELKCYKELAQALGSRPRLFRETFLCRNTGADEIAEGLEPEVALTNPFQLVDAYRQLLDRRKVYDHKVYVDEVPIATCIGRIADELKTRDRISFQQLLPEVSRPKDVISMFLGVLEMARLQMTGIEQDRIFGPIDVVRRVEPNELDHAKRVHGLSWG
jgi:segregation and condensation protein A